MFLLSAMFVLCIYDSFGMTGTYFAMFLHTHLYIDRSRTSMVVRTFGWCDKE
jgi:hypothetical protein